MDPIHIEHKHNLRHDITVDTVVAALETRKGDSLRWNLISRANQFHGSYSQLWGQFSQEILDALGAVDTQRKTVNITTAITKLKGNLPGYIDLDSKLQSGDSTVLIKSADNTVATTLTNQRSSINDQIMIFVNSYREQINETLLQKELESMTSFNGAPVSGYVDNETGFSFGPSETDVYSICNLNAGSRVPPHRILRDPFFFNLEDENDYAWVSKLAEIYQTISNGVGGINESGILQTLKFAFYANSYIKIREAPIFDEGSLTFLYKQELPLYGLTLGLTNKSLIPLTTLAQQEKGDLEKSYHDSLREVIKDKYFLLMFSDEEKKENKTKHDGLHELSPEKLLAKYQEINGTAPVSFQDYCNSKEEKAVNGLAKSVNFSLNHENLGVGMKVQQTYNSNDGVVTQKFKLANLSE